MNVPLFAPVEGALFVDYGTDLDSGSSVLGNPAGESDFERHREGDSERHSERHALFVDYGTNLDSGSRVLGSPAGERDTVSLPLAVSLTVSTVYSRRETR
jgi:outer membrane protein assembly factor BamA